MKFSLTGRALMELGSQLIRITISENTLKYISVTPTGSIQFTPKRGWPSGFCGRLEYCNPRSHVIFCGEMSRPKERGSFGLRALAK